MYSFSFSAPYSEDATVCRCMETGFYHILIVGKTYISQSMFMSLSTQLHVYLVLLLKILNCV